MKPMNKHLAVLGLTTLLIGGAGTALAFGGPRDHHGYDDNHRRGETAMLPVNRLDNLTDEQREQLKQIRRDARDNLQELRDGMRDNRTALRDAMTDNADIATIQGLAKKLGDQVARMIVLRAEVHEKINGLLTAEQQQQLAELRQQGPKSGHHRERPDF